MALQPGSLPWLLAHEMRLGWREFRGKRVIILGIAALVLAFAALMALPDDGFRQDLNQFKTAGALSDEAMWVTAEILFLLLAVTVVMSLRAGTQALFERGDLDLLLTSPLSSQVVFASRLLGIALNTFLGIGAFLLVPVGLLMGLGLMRLWSVLPATLALSLLGTSLGLLVILLLVSPAPPERIQFLKMLAVLIPVWVLAVPLIALLLFRHYPWGWALLLVLGASSCTVLLRRWNAEFGPATGLKKRRQHSSRDPVLRALELLNYLAWFALGVGLNMSMPVLLYASLATIVGLMAVAYLRNRALGPALAF